MIGWGELAASSAAFWGLQLALALCNAARVPATSTLPPAQRSAWPRLTLIVPARDEGDDIEEALRSKLATRYPELEVVAVDDRSADATGAIMERLASSDARLVVEHVRALPDGWLGKLHAVQRGLERSTGEWVLISDADVFLEGDVLERVIDHAEREQLDFLAVMPGIDHSHGLLDAVLVNFIRVISLLGRMWRANDDASSIGVGVGAFNLVRRAALERTPGLAHLRMDVADDMALGAMLKTCGARTRLFAGRDEVHLRFYSSLAGLARSWEKFGTVFEFTRWRPLVVLGLVLALELGFALGGLAAGGLAAAVGALALALGTLVHVVVTAHFGLRWRGVAVWGVGLLVGYALLVRAAFVTAAAQGVRWRGTFYGRDELLRGRRFYAGHIDVGGRRPPGR